MLRWPGEWLNGSGWPSAITTAGTVLQNILWKHLILQGQDMPTRSQLHILQLSAFLSYVQFEPDHAVSSEQWQTQLETEQRQFKYWAQFLDFQFCVLRFEHSVRCGDYHPCVQCPTKRMPWRFFSEKGELWDLKLWAHSASSAVEHLLCGKQCQNVYVPESVQKE